MRGCRYWDTWCWYCVEMLTLEQVEEILNEIVGPDQRIVDVQFPNVSVNTRHPERYEKLTGRIIDKMIEVSGTTGPMTFGYSDMGGLGPPEAGVREPRRPEPPEPTIAAEIEEPTTRTAST